jgi:hypothetical protein
VKSGDLTQFKPIPLATANGVNLTPKREYIHPASTHILTTTSLHAGAVQIKDQDE